MTRPLVRAVFALLVVATIAAFLVTQQLKSEFPLVIRFAAKPLNFSPNGDGVRDTHPARLRPLGARPGHVLGDGPGGQRGAPARERPRAGGRRQAPRALERPRRRRGCRCPTASTGCGCVRRDEGRVIDSIKEINVDTPAAAGRAPLRAPERDRARGAGPAPRGAPALQRPVERGARVPGLPHRGRPAAAGSALPRRRRPRAVWDGRLREGRVAPEGDYAFTVQVRDRAGNPTEAPAPDAERAHRPAGNRACRSGRFTLSGPLDGGPRRRPWRACEVGPFDRSFEFVLSRLGSPRPVVRGERIGGSLPCAGAAPDAHRRLPGARAGRATAAPSGRWPWPGLPQTPGSAGPTAAARGAAGALVAGPQPRGRRPRRLRGHAPRGAAAATRARVRGRRAAAAASGRRARRCCASSTGRGSTTT